MCAVWPRILEEHWSEERLKELCPALSNAMLVGDKRKYNVVLLTAKTVLDLATGLSTGTLALEALEVFPRDLSRVAPGGRASQTRHITKSAKKCLRALRGPVSICKNTA